MHRHLLIDQYDTHDLIRPQPPTGSQCETYVTPARALMIAWPHIGGIGVISRFEIFEDDALFGVLNIVEPE